MIWSLGRPLGTGGLGDQGTGRPLGTGRGGDRETGGPGDQETRRLGTWRLGELGDGEALWSFRHIRHST